METGKLIFVVIFNNTVQDEMRRIFVSVSSNNISSFVLLSKNCTIRRKYTVICCTLNLFITTVFSTIVKLFSYT